MPLLIMVLLAAVMIYLSIEGIIKKEIYWGWEAGIFYGKAAVFCGILGIVTGIVIIVASLCIMIERRKIEELKKKIKGYEK